MHGEKELHDPPLLFNLSHDPSEQFNIAEDHPEIIGQINSLVQEHQSNLVMGADQLAEMN